MNTHCATDSQSIPTAPNGLPLLGHLAPLLVNPWRFLSRLPSYGDVVRLRFGPVASAVVVCSPGLTWEVLRHPRIFDKGGAFIERSKEVAGNGLITCPHRDHRRLRQLQQPAFHTKRLPGYTQAMSRILEETTKSWHDGQTLDVSRVMYEITARILGETMFADAMPPEVLHQALDGLPAIVKGVYRRMLMPRHLDGLPTLGNLRYRRADRYLQNALADVIATRRDSNSDEDHGDLLSALLAAQDPEASGDAQRLSDEELIDQLRTLFLAGVETNATALAWALHLVGTHPEVAQRLHDEVDTVLGGRAATYEDLPQLDLTRRAILETLRLYPPAWILTRLVTEDTRLGGDDGYDLPAGTTVIYSPYLVHHRADVYPDPERFDPDRWDGRNPLHPPRDDYLPFGGGARKCIGDRFALHEAVITLATIAARWDLTPLPGQRVRPARGAAIVAPHGLRMRTVSRQP